MIIFFHFNVFTNSIIALENNSFESSGILIKVGSLIIPFNADFI